MRSFEDYCWRDIVSDEMVHIFSAYHRERSVPKRSALIVVHPAKDFVATVQPDWPLAARRIAETARRLGLAVIHSVPAGASPVTQLPALENEPVCRRPCDSAFLFTDLEAILTRSGSSGIVVCGAPTSGAVRVTAVEGKSYGYKVAIAEEATGDQAALLHKIALFDVAHKYADVMSADELLASMEPNNIRGAA